MQLFESTHRTQSALANYCRTGTYTPISGANETNIAVYRELAFDVIEDMLQSTFPLTHELLSEEWLQLVQDFFSNHACKSPQVWYMPKELYEYLSSIEQDPFLKKYPYLLELIWFEWLETELYMMEDQVIAHRLTGNINTDRLVLNPESHFQHFCYPVHLKNAKSIASSDQADYYLTAHRVPETGDVLFTDISPALLRILELLADKPATILELTQHVCLEFGISYTEDILKTTTAFAEQSLASKLIIGFDVS